jgi:hypothetical protein
LLSASAAAFSQRQRRRRIVIVQDVERVGKENRPAEVSQKV